MLVTQSTFVGYTIVNGTFGIQFAMLVASTYNLFVFGNFGNYRQVMSDEEIDLV